MAKSVVFAVDIGGKSVKTGIVNDTGLIAAFEPAPIPANVDSESFFSLLRSEITRNVSAIPDMVPQAVGIGVPGNMDRETGVSHAATNLPWPKTNFKTLVESWTGLETFVEHDVRNGAIAESRFGALRGIDDFLYVAIGTGIGGAIAIRGELYLGSSGFTGELGHTMVLPGGERCSCGRIGCLEAYCSAKHIERRYRERTSQSLSCKDIGEAARCGEETARQVWDEATDALALALANYHTLLQPKAIVIGGGVARAGEDLLLQPTIAKMKSLAPMLVLPHIALSALKHQSALVGAGYQAILRRRGEMA